MSDVVVQLKLRLACHVHFSNYYVFLVAVLFCKLFRTVYSLIYNCTCLLLKTISDSTICHPLLTLQKPALLNVPHPDDFIATWSVLTMLSWPLSRWFTSCEIPELMQSFGQGLLGLWAAAELCKAREFVPDIYIASMYMCVKPLLSLCFPEASYCWPMLTCSLL